MGYRTYHSLTVYDKNMESVDSEKFEQELVDEDIGFFEDEIKWYDHREEMCEYSKRYPDLIFCLHGEGEQSEDLWDEYYVNGRYQAARAVITYPEFDESKLEDL